MSFQEELNKATRTPSEAASSKHNEEFTKGMDLAESSYREIKEQLLEMAQDGKYSYKNGKKQIVLYYKNYWVQSDFELDCADTSVNKTFFNPKGKNAHRMYYTITNRSHFDGFMSRIKELWIGSMKTLCAKLDSNIRYRLRMCIWKHWKTPQNRAKNLMKLGIEKNRAFHVAYAGYRIAYVCNKGAVNVAISNKRLTQFGLVSMLDYYTKRCVTC